MIWPIRLRLIDRYMLTELAGPLFFGLSAFTLIFVATQLLALSRFVSEEHAPLWAAVGYFLWGLPAVMLYVIPMAILLGVLLALQRLSGESEITAFKSGGISLERIAAPLLIFGFVLSLVTFFLQENFVPYANDRATAIEQNAIRRLGAQLANNLTVFTPLPGGGRQLTAATALDTKTQTMLNVTVIQYDAAGKPQTVLFSDRAKSTNGTSSWRFENARSYRFDPDGSVFASNDPILDVDIGQNPSQLLKRARGNPEAMSRSEIATVVQSGQLSPGEVRTYDATYQAKLARPFACFVFTLIALPFGLGPVRGGGTSLGFGLAVAVAFVYFVVSSVSLSVASMSTTLAGIMAWFPNVLFTAIGTVLLRRASGF